MKQEQLTSDPLLDALERLVDVAREQFGETQWRYEKKRIVWGRFRNRPGYHTVPVGDGEEVSKDEYDANIADSKHYELEAFMGRLPRSYTRYDRCLARPGWRERLVEMIQAAESFNG